jgi:hypothetical protein
MKRSLNIQELLHSEFKHHGINPMHFSLSGAFQRHEEYNPGSMDLITAKQNKLPSFIDIHR